MDSLIKWALLFFFLSNCGMAPVGDAQGDSNPSGQNCVKVLTEKDSAGECPLSIPSSTSIPEGCKDIVYLFMSDNGDKCVYQAASINANQSPPESSQSLPYCQSNLRFLTIRNVAEEGIGFLHQLDDFIRASILAISLNRTLVDYMPVFTPNHSIDTFGNHILYPDKFFLAWSFRHFLNRDLLVFNIRDQGRVHNCKLRLTSEPPSENEISTFGLNVASIDYARDQFPGHPMRIKEFLKDKSVVLNGNRWTNSIRLQMRGRPLNLFFVKAAESVRHDCLAHQRKLFRSLSPSDFLSQQSKVVSSSKFFVVHIRGTDRPCVKTWLTPKQIASRIELLLHRRAHDIIYMMTDLKRDNEIVEFLAAHFGDKLYQAADIRLFEKEPFRSNGYMRYLTELALQRLSDGFVSTYKSHQMVKEKNELGYIVNITHRYVKTC